MTHPHERLNDAFATPVRLSAMAALTPGVELSFSTLRDLIETSDSQMSKAITLLEEHGYVTITRSRDPRRSRVYVSATRNGLAAFAAHLHTLQQIIDIAANREPRSGQPSQP